MKLIALVLILLFGMAELSQAQSQESVNQVSTYLNRAIGKMTYDDALAMWGPPTSVAEGDKIRTTVWVQNNQQPGVYFQLPPIGSIPGPIIGGPIERGWRMELVFGKQTGKLRGWKYKEW